MKRINETQLRILEALHTYRFLNTNQLIKTGIVRSKYAVSENMKVLHSGNKPLVTYADFGNFPNIGRLPRLYYLTKYGAEWLAEAFHTETAEINYPKGVKIFTRDYFHRVATIDLHIEARLFAQNIEGLQVDFFHTYFEHTGSNHTKNKAAPRRQALTKIPLKESYFIPDCIFQITDPDNTPWLFTGEIYRNHTTKRTHQQLEKHLLSMVEGAIQKVYEHQRGVRVLLVCEEQGAMNALMKRVKEDTRFTKTEPFFLFKTINEMKENFASNWQTFTGRKTNLFVR